MTMNPITSFPPADMPLRARLPNMSDATRQRLTRWAMMQPGALPWLLCRGALYWDKFPGPPCGEGPHVPAAADAHHALLDATAALDLLRHRIQCADDKAAVQHLEDPLGNDKTSHAGL